MAWTAALFALVLSLGGGVVLTRIATSCYLRGQLQVRADQMALAVANDLAGHFDTDRMRLAAASGPVTLGRWDAARRRFQPGLLGINAVQVVVNDLQERPSYDWWSPWFAPDRSVEKTRAVAALRPRDIVLVVDLSSEMSSQTWTALDRLMSSAVPTEDESLPGLYADLGYEAYPGPLEPFGAPWQTAGGPSSYPCLVSDHGPLAHPAVEQRYRIVPGDPVSLRRRKVYQAVIDRQVLRLMPQALPRPDDPENFDYWAAYLDDVLASSGQYARIGYGSYIRYMLRQGRSIQVASRHVPLSPVSQECVWHTEVVCGRPYRVPPRIQPMHDVRRGLLEALRDVAVRSAAFESALDRDRVAIITFDSLSPGGAWLEQTLTGDYRAASKRIAALQPVGARAQPSDGLAALKLAESLLEQSRHNAPWQRDVTPLVLLVTARFEDPLARQIAAMAQRGQSVKVIPVGPAREMFAGVRTGKSGDSLSVVEERRLSGRSGDRQVAESDFRDAVASASVVLVE